MRVISLVPSLTETLVECGVDVVGRTRFCIHPADKVANIRVVGGTKGVNWAKCAELKPDLVVFDKEENLLQMADECPYQWTATHIQSVEDAPSEFSKLADLLNSDSLADHAEEWQAALAQQKLSVVDWACVPGQLQALNGADRHYQRIEYVIWRDPWMVVSRNTFIGSMLARLGFGDKLVSREQKYPSLAQQDMTRDDTFYLFSSEPYRFDRQAERLKNDGFNGAIVDGELYSWFGLRSLKGLLSYTQAH